MANCLLTARHLGRDKERWGCGTWQAGREGETKQASVCGSGSVIYGG